MVRFGILFLLSTSLFSSCKSEYAMLQEDLQIADGARVQFYEPGTTNVTANYEIGQYDDEMPMLRRAMTKKNTEETKCSPDGRIVFYSKGNVLLETDFQMQPDCNNISFIYRNRLYYKRLSDDALAYLKEMDSELNERFKKYE